jgi:hypothetical protein
METENTAALSKNCSFILRRETEILKKISVLQNELWYAVVNRIWTDFEANIEALNVLRGEFEALETRREKIISEFPRAMPASPVTAYEEKSNFYLLVSRFPEDFRKELTALYRELKMETLRIRLSNEAFVSYLGEARASVADFLEASFPDRGGKLYTRRGTEVPRDMRSMVLNQRL